MIVRKATAPTGESRSHFGRFVSFAMSGALFTCAAVQSAATSPPGAEEARNSGTMQFPGAAWEGASPESEAVDSAQLGRAGDAITDVAVSGRSRVWHPMSLSFRGPTATETDDDPNPFLDYRLQVTLTGPSRQTYTVPGFFDGDGRGGATGNVWRVRFAPDQSGPWDYRVSFRAGSQIAVSLAPDEGRGVAFDGQTGSFDVEPRDPQAPGFLKWGRLAYVGKHYLKFKDGPYWIRGGTDSPENLLGYAGFDNTPASHTYATHVVDWRPGDPDWGNGKGRGIIGALNYLASKHVNSIYFLTMNVGGDGQDVWPWAGSPEPKGSPDNDNVHYDVSKLRQWQTVFDHAQRNGIFLHVVFNEAEAENKRELDEGELGVERKLYYREMIARFGGHLALEWNLCEEYNLQFDFGAERIRAFADYIRQVDPYDHPITVHSAGDPVKKLAFTFGDERFGLTSIQLNQRPIHEVTEAIRAATARAGRPLPVSLDEFTVDRGQGQSHIPVDDADGYRKEKLWPTYLSGGMIEFILEGLLDVDSFKTPERDALWDYVWHARKFMQQNLPFWEMEPADELITGSATIPVGIGRGRSVPLPAQVFAKRDEVYAIYLPKANPSGTLDLTTARQTFHLRWYNPRRGAFEGEPRVVRGGARVPFGPPPSTPDEDWVVLLTSTTRSETTSGAAPGNASGQRESFVTFPGKHWQQRSPEDLGLTLEPLDRLRQALGGRGCVVKDGYVVAQWGDQSEMGDWLSSAKPMLSTLLFFAMEEQRVRGVDQPIADFGWEFSLKDQGITFRHLGSMTSGYARPEPPGAAWAYNDFAIQLYQKTLFDRVFKEDPKAVAEHPDRFGALQLEDGLSFRKSNRRLSASVRDFARIAWFWLNRGRWGDRQVLPRRYFDEYMTPQVPADLPHTARADTNDYLGIGSFGGGSDHFTEFGAGIYGFNWWFNGTGRLHPNCPTWPAAPPDAIMSIGAGGNCSVLIPGQNLVLVCARGRWGQLQAGDAQSTMNQLFQLLAQAVAHERP